MTATPDQKTARESLRDYRILHEVAQDGNVSQRDLAKVSGLNLATINQILKRLVRKGYVKTRRINARRVAYYLTPQGFSEKMRLVLSYTRQTISFFAAVRTLVNQRLTELKEERDIRTVAIAGTGELAEAVFLSVQEQGLDLVAVLDGLGGHDPGGHDPICAANRDRVPRQGQGQADWLGVPLTSMDEGLDAPADVLVVTVPGLSDRMRAALDAAGTHTVHMDELLSARLAAFAERIGREASGVTLDKGPAPAAAQA